MPDPRSTAPGVQNPWLRVVLLATVLAIVYGLGRLSGITDDVTVERVRELMVSAGVLGFLGFIAAFALGQLLYIPGVVFVAAAGLAYGPILGPVAAVLGATVSVAVSFVVVRTIGGQPLRDVRKPLLRKLLDRLDERPVRSMILMRLVFWALPPLNYSLAMSGVRFRDYMVAALVGLTPPFAAMAAAVALGLDWI